jgi:hypothetical protein
MSTYFVRMCKVFVILHVLNIQLIQKIIHSLPRARSILGKNKKKTLRKAFIKSTLITSFVKVANEVLGD